MIPPKVSNSFDKYKPKPIALRSDRLRTIGGDFGKPASDESIRNMDVRNIGKNVYSEPSFDKAYQKARANGESEFIYGTKRYNTKYKGTPEQQFNETGITDEQIQGRSIIRDRLYNNLKPVSYRNMPTRLFDSIVLDKKQKYKDEITPTRADLFSVYSGKKAENGKLSISKYKPQMSEGDKTTYYALKDSATRESILNNPDYLETWDDEDDSKQELIKNKGVGKRANSEGAGLGNFKTYKGEDEKGKYISYYDKWDLTPFRFSKNTELPTDFGKPFEIYDRIYYKDNPMDDKATVMKNNNNLKNKYQKQELELRAVMSKDTLSPFDKKGNIIDKVYNRQVGNQRKLSALGDSISKYSKPYQRVKPYIMLNK